MKKTRKVINLIASVSSLVLTLTLLIITIYGWYTSNNIVSTSTVSATTDYEDEIYFDSTILAERTFLNGDRTVDTYVRNSNGNLYLIKRVTYKIVGGSVTSTTENHLASDKIPFSMSSILPGEHIDVTIGFYLNSRNNGMNYTINLANIAYGDPTDADNAYSFIVDGKVHYALGAFRYYNVSLRTENSTYLFNNTTLDDYTWLSTYDINSDDEKVSLFELYSGTWNNSYGKLYYTFRIEEDFSQYYRLLESAQGAYAALLSEKKVKIGNIFFTMK